MQRSTLRCHSASKDLDNGNLLPVEDGIKVNNNGKVMYLYVLTSNVFVDYVLTIEEDR